MNVVLLERPSDATALDAALALGETVAVTIGDTNQASLAAGARLRGATRSIRIWDKALSDVDYLATALVLARAVKKVVGEELEGTLVFTGDGAHAAVGAAVAERLGLPSLTSVCGVERSGNRVVATTRHDGRTHRYVVPSAAVVCVGEGEAAVVEAAAGDSEMFSLSDVGVSPAELLHRRHFVPRNLKESA